MPLTQIADRTWIRRPADGSATATVVAGSGGTCVVDPPTTRHALAELVSELEATSGPTLPATTAWTRAADGSDVTAARDRLGPAPVHLHDSGREAVADAGCDPEQLPGVVWFSSASVVDLGDRTVELLHLGRGPGAGATVAVLTATDVLVVGDLVAPPGATPALGPDSHPLDWPLTLDLVLGLTGEHTLVVPAHGPPVARSAVEEQRRDLGVLAETIRDLVERGVAPDEALTDTAAAATWPYPTGDLGHAVRRGYAQLPRSQRRLPLV